MVILHFISEIHELLSIRIPELIQLRILTNIKTYAHHEYMQNYNVQSYYYKNINPTKQTL
jgi:hypothetical protein